MSKLCVARFGWRTKGACTAEESRRQPLHLVVSYICHQQGWLVWLGFASFVCVMHGGLRPVEFDTASGMTALLSWRNSRC
jgi:hypothetical protein